MIGFGKASFDDLGIQHCFFHDEGPILKKMFRRTPIRGSGVINFHKKIQRKLESWTTNCYNSYQPWEFENDFVVFKIFLTRICPLEFNIVAFLKPSFFLPFSGAELQGSQWQAHLGEIYGDLLAGYSWLVECLSNF